MPRKQNIQSFEILIGEAIRRDEKGLVNEDIDVEFSLGFKNPTALESHNF